MLLRHARHQRVKTGDEAAIEEAQEPEDGLPSKATRQV